MKILLDEFIDLYEMQRSGRMLAKGCLFFANLTYVMHFKLLTSIELYLSRYTSVSLVKCRCDGVGPFKNIVEEISEHELFFIRRKKEIQDC